MNTRSNDYFSFKNTFKQALTVTLILLLICGLLFPLALTAISAVFFPSQAKGSLVMADGKPVGSINVGQDFKEDYFMKGRPSAYNYNTYVEDENGNKTYLDGSEFGGLGSGSQNLAPSSPLLKERVEKDLEEFLNSHPDVKKEDVPLELLTASGSGLDPHITVESAMIQIPKIAKASGLTEEELTKIVKNNTKGKVLGIFGEETVNVLGVNLEIALAMGLVSNIEK